MIDPNNRPGGPNLIVTAKTAGIIQFFDAVTLQKAGEIAMPASTHEMVLSADGAQVYASVYGGGIFGKNSNPDRRIAVIDLAAKSLARMIDVGENVAPHSLMLDADGILWCTLELASAAVAIDMRTGAMQQVETGKAAHWLAISHTADKVFAACKTSDFVAVIDRKARRMTGRLAIPTLSESLCVSPDGGSVYVCSHQTPELYVFDAQTNALRHRLKIAGGEDKPNQLKRVRISPDGKYVCVSSLLDNHAAIFDAASLKQITSIATPKGPMGFGFAEGGERAYLCCHDDAVVLDFELASGRLIRQFPTAPGCEFIISYC
jgi:DNA-binding beta-propeller fold protein YncE